jgi:hypothetical protein
VFAAPAAGAAVGVRAGATPPPPPGLGIRLTEAPTNRRDDPRAQTTVVDHVAPGTTFTRGFEATNGSDQPMSVRYYVRPATLAGGGFAIDDANENEITQWASITPAEAVLPAGGGVPATLRVAVPASAPAGEYYGAVIVERPAPTSGGGARIATRAAVAVYLSVGAGGEPRSDFSVTTLTASRDADGAPVVRAEISNTGGRALSVSGDLRLSEGPGGLSAGPFPAKLGTVVGIGQSVPVTVLLDKALPNGPWLATLSAQSGLIKRTAQATITFPEEGEGEAVAAEAVDDDGSDGLPLLVIGGAVAAGAAALAAAAALFQFNRRVRLRGPRSSGGSGSGAPEET